MFRPQLHSPNWRSSEQKGRKKEANGTGGKRLRIGMLLSPEGQPDTRWFCSGCATPAFHCLLLSVLAADMLLFYSQVKSGGRSASPPANMFVAVTGQIVEEQEIHRKKTTFLVISPLLKLPNVHLGSHPSTTCPFVTLQKKFVRVSYTPNTRQRG